MANLPSRRGGVSFTAPSPRREIGGSRCAPAIASGWGVGKSGKQAFHQVLYSEALPPVQGCLAHDFLADSYAVAALSTPMPNPTSFGAAASCGGRSAAPRPSARSGAARLTSRRCPPAGLLGPGGPLQESHGHSSSSNKAPAVPPPSGDIAKAATSSPIGAEQAEREARLRLVANVLGSVSPAARTAPDSKNWTSASAAAAAARQAAAEAAALAACMGVGPDAEALQPSRPANSPRPGGMSEDMRWRHRRVQQQATVAHKKATAAGLRAAQIRAEAADAEVASVLRGCSQVSQTTTSPKVAREHICSRDAPPPDGVRASAAASRGFFPSELVGLVTLPTQLLLRLAVWLAPFELVRLLAAHSALALAGECVAAWMASDLLGLSAEVFAAQRQLLQVRSLRALHFAQLCAEATHRAWHRQLAAGLQHAMVVRQGVAYSWGAATSGQLGRGSPAERFHPVPTAIHLSTPVTTVACGGDHSLLVTQCGSVWAFGRNSDGQLGTGSDRDSARPVQMPVPRAVQAACGADHSLVLGADGSLWACGRGAEGQLGVGLPKGQERALLPVHAAGAPPQVRHISCGADHSVILDASGNAYSFGENSKGQLGLDHCSNQCLPTRMQMEPGTLIVDSDCGGTHTLLITDDARALGCGGNDQGQLGSGCNDDRLVPEPVLLRWTAAPSPAVARASRISCGFSHSLLLTATGNVWVLGCRGAAGIRRRNQADDMEAAFGPWRVRGVLERCRVDDVAAGGGHALCAVGEEIFSLAIGPKQQRGPTPEGLCRTPTPHRVDM